MRLKTLFLSLVIWIFLWSSLALSANLFRVSVFDFKAGVGLSQGDAVILTDSFREILIDSKKMIIIDRRNMETVLKEWGYNLNECTEQGCAIQFGRILQSDKIIVGSISRLGDKFYIKAEMVDVESGASIIAKSDYCSGTVGDLPEYMKNLAIKIADAIQVEGKVINIAHDEVMVDLGKDVGMKKGMFLSVNCKGEAILDPLTFVVKEYNWIPVAELQIVDFIGESISRCKVEKSLRSIEPGDRVRQIEFGGEVEQKGIIEFRISPGEVYLVKDGTPSGYIPVPKTGLLRMRFDPGSHSITFTREGMQYWSEELVISGGETRTIEVNFIQREPDVPPPSGYGILHVKSTPDQATVYIDGVERGVTTYQATKIVSGIHTVEIQKSLYKPYVETVTIESDAVSYVNHPLEPDFGKLTISSQPSGAMVYIDDQQKGVTPYKVERFQSGEYDLRLVKTLYHEHNQKFSVDAGGDSPINVNLKPAFGSLYITSDPTGAMVMVDEQSWGITPVKKDTVLSGQHTVLLRKELYSDYEEIVPINDGKPTTVNAPMNKNFGTLYVDSEPRDAEVYIAGQAGKLGNTPVERNLMPGVYRLQIQKDLYETYEQTVNLGIGDVQKISPKLNRKSGRLVIITVPSEAEIYLEGKHIGKTPQIINEQPTGTYKVVLKMSGYGDVRKKVEIKYKEEFRIDIPLSKTAWLEWRKRKMQTIIMSIVIPGSGQMIPSKQTFKGFIYFAAFAGVSYMAYDSYVRYEGAKDDYYYEMDKYYNASLQYEIYTHYNAMMNHQQRMDDFDFKHKVFLAAAGGIWAWNIIDALIWGGGKKPVVYTDLQKKGGKIEFVFFPNKLGIVVNF